MKIVLFLLIIAKIFATGESISCYNCYEGPEPKRNVTEFDVIKVPTRRCAQHFGRAFGAVCTAPATCATLKEVSIDGETFLFHYCSSSSDVDETFPIQEEEYRNENVTIRIKKCKKNYCNRPFSASSTIKATSLTLVLLLIPFLI